jgi:hypothetical protein
MLDEIRLVLMKAEDAADAGNSKAFRSLIEEARRMQARTRADALHLSEIARRCDDAIDDVVRNCGEVRA